jgi:hypothetical protein
VTKKTPAQIARTRPGEVHHARLVAIARLDHYEARWRWLDSRIDPLSHETVAVLDARIILRATGSSDRLIVVPFEAMEIRPFGVPLGRLANVLVGGIVTFASAAIRYFQKTRRAGLTDRVWTVAELITAT